MRIIVLPVGRCWFLEENESGLRFRGTKYGGLRNVRPPIIDPLSKEKLSNTKFSDVVRLNTQTTRFSLRLVTSVSKNHTELAKIIRVSHNLKKHNTKRIISLHTIIIITPRKRS